MMKYEKSVEKWDVFEVSCQGKTEGNPFVDYDIKGEFKSKNETVAVDGFYDGNGIYKVRFMPSFEEEYSFQVYGSFSKDREEGSFVCRAAGRDNHGPVRIANTYHFAYEDGTPYYSIGTTCYVWQLQPDERIEETFQSLSDSGFNKIRFCVFPKHYDYNLGEPRSYPYEGKPCDSSVLTKENFMEYTGAAEGNDWDFTRFHTEYFRHLERCIMRLCKMGVEADVILLHPYDRWGFSTMTKEQDDLYIRYVAARLSAFRNVWWSLANEYDLMPQKSIGDWERIAGIICKNDPYHHLRSIHNCHSFYDHSRPWITHLSIQRQDVYKSAELTGEWRERYKKPVVLDEIAYEGDIQHGWGNISGRELTRRFWEAACRGGYAGHGETYLNGQDVLWWSHGGILHGESPKRLEFLYEILCETPGIGLAPTELNWDEVTAVPDTTYPSKEYYLTYFGFNRPRFREYYFDDESWYEVEVLDTWEMTRTKAGIFRGKFRVELPGKEYMALRIKKVEQPDFV